MTMEDVAPKGQKSTGRGVSPCYWFVRKQSAEGATVPVFLSPFQGCHAGCLLLQGLHPCLCSDTPSGLIAPMCHSDDRQAQAAEKRLDVVSCLKAW